MANLISVHELFHEYRGNTVLEGVSLGVGEGDRIGIVGPNGEGKSTLLSLICQRLEPVGGRVVTRAGQRVGFLAQGDELDPDMTIADVIIQGRAEHEWAGDPRTREVIAGLVPELDFATRIGELSGGQRRRVALAGLLVGEWDVIALDEPTNHLDIQAITFLANHVKNRWPAGQGAFLVVTHDRWFLDEACQNTWEVHSHTVEPFEGGYAAYVLARVERARQAAQAEAKRQNLMRKELAWLRRGAPARTSKPRFRIEAANALIADVPQVRNKLELARLSMARLGKDVVDLLDVSAGYGEEAVLENVTWRIAPGERSAILGTNGAGKSTLLHLIDGSLAPRVGRVERGKTVHIATLDQEYSQLGAHEGERVREVLARYHTSYMVDGKELSPSQLLERLGFQCAHLSSLVSELSGGQRRRLQLLLVLLEEPNVLILDEPTNDMDTDMLAVMEDLLDSWPGTLIVVSHDRYFVERVSDQQYAIIGKHLRHLPGGVDEYMHLAAQARSGARAAEEARPAEEATAGEAGLSGAQLHAAQKASAALERKIDKLNTRREKLHAQMAEADQSNFEVISSYTAQLREIDEQVAALEEEWLGVLATLEGA